MRQSLPGLAKAARRALERSPDDFSCMTAFSICELVDNLRKVKDGQATLDEFFAVYVFEGKVECLADTVKNERFLCMQDEPAEDETEDAEKGPSCQMRYTLTPADTRQ